MSAAFRQSIDDRTAVIAVVGLGYVGMPLALAFGRARFRVIGFDVDRGRVAELQAGRSYLMDIGADAVQELVASGRLRPTDDAATLAGADVIFVCVPTPFDRSRAPDLRYIEAAARSIAAVLRRGQLVLLESTTYPGTTEEILVPILETSGLKAGTDFFVAFSPERIDPGNRQYGIENTPKVVGGIDAESTARAATVLQQVVDKSEVRAVSTPRVAELTKLLENTFRAVNIALVNELTMLCDRMGIDIWEVIEAAKTKPYGFMPFYPGPGVGGHCLASGEWVYVRDRHGADARQIDRVWTEAAERSSPRALGDVEVIDGPGVQALGIGLDGPPGWEDVTHLFRRVVRGDLVTLMTADGRSVTVTDGHPMLAVRDDSVQTVAARDMREGDLLPIFGDPVCLDDRPDPIVDLFPHLSPEQRHKTRVRIIGGSWTGHRSLVRQAFGARADDLLRADHLPLDGYLQLEAAGAPVPVREQLMLWTGRGRGSTGFPAVVRVTPDLARLIGYYVTEGCTTNERGRPRVRFTFHPDERDLIADCTTQLGRLGVRWSTHRDRNWKALHVRASSALFAIFLRDALRCGSASLDAAVPEVLLACGPSHRTALLSGLLRGDGSVDAHTGPRTVYDRRLGRPVTSRNATASLAFWTSSPRLERQMCFLLQSLGIRSSIQRRRTQQGADFHILGVDSVQRLAPLFVDAKGERLRASLVEKRRWPRSRGLLKAAGQWVAAVERIERRDAEAVVYSLETARTHTFATGQGIFLHNCIPVDPYYLSWKAREFDFSTKFIEIAAEINLEMPFFTVEKLRRTLRERGVALAGADLLVLGAAFKRDTDDARNSSAIRVMEILCAEGARVRYHDPHVPQIRIATGLYGDHRGEILLRSIDLTDTVLREVDCVVILVGHTTVDHGRVVESGKLVFDAVNATAGSASNGRLVRL